MMDIVEELRRDRESGAKRLIAEYKAGLMTLARRFCVDEGDAEELVNATFAKAVDNIDGYLEKSAFFAWLCQILTNEFRNSVKRKSNQNEVYPGVLPEVEDEDARNEIYDHLDASLLREAIAELQPEQREVIVLRYFEDLPIAKIAKFLALPAGTVRSRIFYARKELARRLGAEVKETVKKPGVKATLLALALFATAALGAVWWGELSERAAEGEPRSVAADIPETPDIPDINIGNIGNIGNTATTLVPPVPDVPFVPDVPSSISSKEPTMNATTRTAALGAATALALAAAPPAASADDYQYIISGDPVAAATEGMTASRSTPPGPLEMREHAVARSRTSALTSKKPSPFTIIVR